jgi:hypothetical protein
VPGRGRDPGCPGPPAQIRTCGTTAYGSYLGSNVPAFGTYPLQPAWHVCFPSLRTGHVGPVEIPLGQPLSLHRLRSPRAALFAGFSGTVGLSDFSWPFIAALRLSSSLRVPTWHPLWDNHEISRLPRKEFPRMRGFVDRAGSAESSRYRARRCGLPRRATASAPGFGLFRGSLACLRVPLSTLRLVPRGARHMTRGQGGSLLLPCTTLAFATPCRLNGASARARAPARARSSPLRILVAHRLRRSPAAFAESSLRSLFGHGHGHGHEKRALTAEPLTTRRIWASPVAHQAVPALGLHGRTPWFHEAMRRAP